MKNFWENDVILLNVFSYLPVKALNSLARVCQKWHRLVNETKDRRQKNVSFIFFDANNSWTSTKGLDGLKQIYLEKKIFIDKFKLQVSNLMVEPLLFIFFYTPDFFDSPKCLINSNDQMQVESVLEVAKRKNVDYISRIICSCLPKKSIKLFLCPEAFVTNNQEFIGNKFEQLDYYKSLHLFNNIIEQYKPVKIIFISF
jgi:hypothetical protein